MAFIVDASVTVAWFVRSQASSYTDRIRRLARSHRLHVPAVWPLEFSNALWQLERWGLLSREQVDTILELVAPLDIVVADESPAIVELVGVARRHNLSSYDASYLELARDLRHPVACRDGALRHALKAAGLRLDMELERAG